MTPDHRHGLRSFIIGLACLLVLAACAPMTSRNNQPGPVLGSAAFVSTFGETVKATYYANGTVELTFPDGERKLLKQAVSGSGTRYMQDGRQWWEHQGVGTYSVNEKPVFIGTVRK